MNAKETLALIIGIALGAAIELFGGNFSGWILLFLGLFLLVVFAIQVSGERKELQNQ